MAITGSAESWMLFSIRTNGKVNQSDAIFRPPWSDNK